MVPFSQRPLMSFVSHGPPLHLLGGRVRMSDAAPVSPFVLFCPSRKEGSVPLGFRTVKHTTQHEIRHHQTIKAVFSMTSSSFPAAFHQVVFLFKQLLSCCIAHMFYLRNYNTIRLER